MSVGVEIWKPVPGLGGHFEASSVGRIRRKQRIVTKFCAMVGRVVQQTYGELILSPSPGPYGHLRCHISVDGKKINLSVHRSVLAAFVGPCPDGMEGCHTDGDATNNRVENLRWDTHRANNGDRKLHGRYPVGAAHPMAKLSIKQVRTIRAAISHVEAARETGLSYQHVWRIRNGLTWSDAK